MTNKPRIMKSLARPFRDSNRAMRDLLSEFSNVEEASRSCRVRPSTLSGYANPNQESSAPVDVVLALERKVGRPVVTRYMANRLGYELYRLPIANNADPLARRISRIVKKGSKAFTTAANALEDGKVTPPEAEQLLDDVESAIAAFVELSLGLEIVVKSRKPYRLSSL